MLNETEEFKSHDSIICTDNKQVFVRVEETGIPTSLVEKLTTKTKDEPKKTNKKKSSKAKD